MFRLWKPILLLLTGVALSTGGNLSAGAQGFILPPHHPRPFPRPLPQPIIQPFYVKNLRVNTVIKDAVAETTVEQTFVNDSSVEQEGTYLFPLPEGATPTAFSMTVGDRTMEPRILSKDEARTIYEGIVRSRRDPALLEYVGRSLVQVSVYPIPAHGERLIRMRYTEVLKPEGGMRRYAYPLSTSRFGSRPVGTVAVSIKVQTAQPLKNVYSPTHDVGIRRPEDRLATISWEGSNEASDRDLTVYFSTSDDDIGLSLLTYKTGDRDGYFMLLAAPRVSVPKNRILPKQVVFVLDKTGSMAGEKIKQARKSLLFCLNSLRPEDRFDVVAFSDSAEPLLPRLELATEANVAKAKRFVENIEANGGTNIDEGLRTGLELLNKDAGKQKMLVFLTDGLPTLGETNIETILQHVKERNGTRIAAEPRRLREGKVLVRNEPQEAGGSAPARIFCFGLGFDVNVPFLDRLGAVGRGDADYVKPNEDIEARVSSFFAKVASPVLADVKIAFDGADVYDMQPKTFPDLFKGSQLVVVGRFRGNGGGTVALTGNANGAKETFRMATKFGEADATNNYLPRIWATRKIGWLVEQVRLSNNQAAQKEVLDEIVRLSREYGIITEYTSFLVDEREAVRLGLRDANGAFREMDGRLQEELRSVTLNRLNAYGEQGAGVTNQSIRGKDLSNADKLASRYQTAGGGVSAQAGEKGEAKARKAAPGNFTAGRGGGGLGGYGGIAGPGGGGRTDRSRLGGTNGMDADAIDRTIAQSADINVQAVADRTFYRQKNNLWQDNSYDAKKQKLVNIQAFSEAHFALLKAVPELASYSSVGEEVLVRVGKNAFQIGKTGKERLSAAEIKSLTTK